MGETLRRTDVRTSDDYEVIYCSQGEALVYNTLTEKVEVYSRNQGVAGWALVINMQDYEFCREANEHDLGGSGHFGSAVREYVETGRRELLFKAYRYADLKRRAILEFIEPRLPDMVAAMDCSLVETHNKVGEVFARSIKD
jgi:hypothetical protein